MIAGRALRCRGVPGALVSSVVRASSWRAQRAFSLVEVVLALGIIAFAFVANIGMLPVGLQTFRDSADKTQTTQIAQNLLAEAQQTPFENLGALQVGDDTRRAHIVNTD